MPGTPYNPYQNLPPGNKVTPVNKGNPAQIGAAIGASLGNTGASQPIFGGVGSLFQGLTIKTFFFYGISAAALIALAEYQPKLAILFAVILIVGVMLTPWEQGKPPFIVSFLKGLTG